MNHAVIKYGLYLLGIKLVIVGAVSYAIWRTRQQATGRESPVALRTRELAQEIEK